MILVSFQALQKSFSSEFHLHVSLRMHKMI